MFLVAIFSLLIGSIIISGFNSTRIKPGYLWFLALIVGAAVWILLILSFPATPKVIPLINWESGNMYSTSPALLLDEHSWSFGVAISTLLMGVLLTDVARVDDIDPSAWAASMAITGAGLVAIFSGNPLTLLFAWAIIDMAETTTLLRQIFASVDREYVIVSLSMKVLGILLVIAAIISSGRFSENLTFENIPIEVGGYLILAAGFRLGVLPMRQPLRKEAPIRRGFGTILSLVPVSASLILLTRVAEIGSPPGWEPYILGITALAGFYGAFSWLGAKNELDGRQFWILGMAALSVASAARGNLDASKMWGLSLLFSGGLLFLYSTRNKWLSAFPLLGWIGITALPFSPTWRGLGLYVGWSSWIAGVFILIQTLMILGYVRHVFRTFSIQDEAERWGWVIYPLGLGIITLTHFWLSVFLGKVSPPAGPIMSTLWWGGTYALWFAALLWVLSRNHQTLIPQITGSFSKIFSFEWLFRAFWWTYKSLSFLIAQAALVLEGEGGVLWAVLVLILLMTAIIQRSGG